jgi:SHS2 domain-containing protein
MSAGGSLSPGCRRLAPVVAVQSHRYVEHVGEIELAVEAASEEGLLAEAASAFRELVDGSLPHGAPLRREIELPVETPALLLVDWLDELVFLAEVEGFVPDRVAELRLDGDRLRATVDGVRGRPRHLVKAVTLHDLAVTCDQRVWHARVVLGV